jgi:hypothetical protein
MQNLSEERVREMIKYIITEEQLNSIDDGELRSYRKMLLDLVRSRPYQNQREKVAKPTIYQCSFCTRNLYNGDNSCPLTLDDESPDLIKGMNRVIKECGCGSFNDSRAKELRGEQ